MKNKESPLPIFKIITLERTPCYGYCPVYKVTILSDGTVRYFGE